MLVVIYLGIAGIAAFVRTDYVAFHECIFRKGISAHGGNFAEPLGGENGSDIVIGASLNYGYRRGLLLVPSVLIAEDDEGAAGVVPVGVVGGLEGEGRVAELAVLDPFFVSGETDLGGNLVQGDIDVGGHRNSLAGAVEYDHGTG